MVTKLDYSEEDVCAMCGDDCSRCVQDQALLNFCSILKENSSPYISLGGCLHYLQMCKIFGNEVEDQFNCALRIMQQEDHLVR